MDNSVGVFFLDDEGKITLPLRGPEPTIGVLDSFGGFVEAGESIEECARREIQEDTGLTEEDYEPLVFLCTAPSEYLYEDELRPTLTTFFYARLKPGAKIRRKNIAMTAYTIALSSLNPEDAGSPNVIHALKKLQKLSN